VSELRARSLLLQVSTSLGSLWLDMGRRERDRIVELCYDIDLVLEQVEEGVEHAERDARVLKATLVSRTGSVQREALRALGWWLRGALSVAETVGGIVIQAATHAALDALASELDGTGRARTGL